MEHESFGVVFEALTLPAPAIKPPPKPKAEGDDLNVPPIAPPGRPPFQQRFPQRETEAEQRARYAPARKKVRQAVAQLLEKVSGTFLEE